MDGKKVVCYCTIGYRSGLYAKSLEEKKQIKAWNVAGSILAWTHAGGELNNSKGAPTNELHTFGRQWALAPAPYKCKYYLALSWT